MKVLFPDGLDLQRLVPTRTEKNVTEKSHALSHDDLLYMISELQKKIGANNSDDPSSLDYKINNRRAGELPVIAGINTIVFETVISTRFIISGLTLINSAGELELAVPILPPHPSGDSRTTTSFDVDCANSGILYWKIEMYA